MLYKCTNFYQTGVRVCELEKDNSKEEKKANKKHESLLTHTSNQQVMNA